MGVRSIFAMAATAALTVCSEAAASPWNRADGDVFLANRFDYYWSSTPISSYSRYGSDSYFEYGVTPDWMLSGKVYYGTRISDSARGREEKTAFGDSELSVQHQIRRGLHSATAISVAGAWSERLTNDTRVAFANSNADIEIRALHGRDLLFAPVKSFVIGELAYRRRFGAAADQIRADALIGVEPTSRFLLLAEARSQISLRNEGPLGDDFDVIKARGSIIWRASSRWALVAGGEKEFAARNIVPGVAVFFGAWSRF
jgi:hypothetical protein